MSGNLRLEEEEAAAVAAVAVVAVVAAIAVGQEEKQGSLYAGSRCCGGARIPNCSSQELSVKLGFM